VAQLQSFKAELFKALSHPNRIRILELLREGEQSVGQLQLALGPEGSTVSQQLAILRMKSLVVTRRAGTAIYYRLRDPQISELLDAARRIFEAHVIQLQSLSEERGAGAAEGSPKNSTAAAG
jgi:DNA-binding transcriptional ArsR family regulator